jgi:hypothetical protein
MFHCKISGLCCWARDSLRFETITFLRYVGKHSPFDIIKHPRRLESSGGLLCEPKVSCLPSTFISVETRDRKRERVTRKLWKMQPSYKPEDTYNLR